MKQIPQTEHVLVLRTDFSDQTVWDEICMNIREPVGIFGFYANVEFLDHEEYANITRHQLLELIPNDYNHTFIIVVDTLAVSQPDHPLLILDLYERSGHEFRAIPSRIQSIENNLSIANMDFEEFSASVDEDGVFRGFPEDRQSIWL